MRISDWSSDVCSSDLFEAALATSPQVAALWQARLAVEDASDPLALDVAGRWLAQMPESVPAPEANMALLGMRRDGEGAEAMARRIVALVPGHRNAQMRIVHPRGARRPASQTEEGRVWEKVCREGKS